MCPRSQSQEEAELKGKGGSHARCSGRWPGGGILLGGFQACGADIYRELKKALWLGIRGPATCLETFVSEGF